MDLRALGYIGIGVEDRESWRRYGELLGAAVSEDDHGLRLRIDDRPFRVLVGEGRDELSFAGWELSDAAALERAAAELVTAGATVTWASAEEAGRRGVRGMLRTTDPGGFTLELFHGVIHDDQRFVSPTGARGFTTGPLGMGHVVLGTPAAAESVAFYTDVLGFRVSDYWQPGGDDVTFLRCNRRHHSLALVPAPEPTLHHFMFETRTLDDVGDALDRHLEAGAPVSMGLGRHTNDQMVSFYSRSPSGFDVEIGCGGLLVDDETWAVTQITEPSSWGHHPPVPAAG